MKIISISIDPWIYETYIQGIKGNRSSFLRGQIVKSFEINDADIPTMQLKNIQLGKKIVELEMQISKLKEEINKARPKKYVLPEKYRKARAIQEGLRASGWNEKI